MSLAERVEQGPPTTRKPCRMRGILEQLPGDEAAALQRMLDDPKWSDSKTYDALKSEGVETLPQTDQFIGWHRRHRCDCP
jgi:hypothetical protein